jgi:hypothetical protein
LRVFFEKKIREIKFFQDGKEGKAEVQPLKWHENLQDDSNDVPLYNLAGAGINFDAKELAEMGGDKGKIESY